MRPVTDFISDPKASLAGINVRTGRQDFLEQVSSCSYAATLTVVDVSRYYMFGTTSTSVRQSSD